LIFSKLNLNTSEMKNTPQATNGKNFKIILVIFLITGSLYFIINGLVLGKTFLVPVVTAIILSMLMSPVAAKFQQWGLARGWAVFLSDLIVVAFIAFMVFLLVAQANRIAGNWPEIESRLQPKIEQAQDYLSSKLRMENLGGQQPEEQGQQQPAQQSGQQQPQQQSQPQDEQQLPPSQQQLQQSEQDQQQQNNQNGSQQQSGQEGNAQQGQQQSSPLSFNPEMIRNQLTGIVSNVFSFLTNLLLMLVYIFFFMYYSEKFKKAVTGLVKEEKRAKTRKIMEESSKTAQNYLFGRFLLITILAVLYMIGFSLAGLEYAIFVALLGALFSLLPYVGNIIALFLALGMSFMSGGGDTGQLIAIVVIFSVIQFVESYLLEPFIVGHEVDVNPVMVIVGVVLGEMIWGVMGMILAIPLLGILKVILDRTESLRPLGYFLDERGISSNGGGGFKEKVMKWVGKK
jgi:predicted PurR-regulated permease PerM